MASTRDSKVKCDPPLPTGFESLVAELAALIFQNNPSDINAFLADYLEKKLHGSGNFLPPSLQEHEGRGDEFKNTSSEEDKCSLRVRLSGIAEILKETLKIGESLKPFVSTTRPLANMPLPESDKSPPSSDLHDNSLHHRLAAMQDLLKGSVELGTKFAKKFQAIGRLSSSILSDDETQHQELILRQSITVLSQLLIGTTELRNQFEQEGRGSLNNSRKVSFDFLSRHDDEPSDRNGGGGEQPRCDELVRINNQLVTALNLVLDLHSPESIERLICNEVYKLIEQVRTMGEAVKRAQDIANALEVLDRRHLGIGECSTPETQIPRVNDDNQGFNHRRHVKSEDVTTNQDIPEPTQESTLRGQRNSHPRFTVECKIQVQDDDFPTSYIKTCKLDDCSESQNTPTGEPMKYHCCHCACPPQPIHYGGQFQQSPGMQQFPPPQPMMYNPIQQQPFQPNFYNTNQSPQGMGYGYSGMPMNQVAMEGFNPMMSTQQHLMGIPYQQIPTNAVFDPVYGFVPTNTDDCSLLSSEEEACKSSPGDSPNYDSLPETYSGHTDLEFPGPVDDLIIGQVGELPPRTPGKGDLDLESSSPDAVISNKLNNETSVIDGSDEDGAPKSSFDDSAELAKSPPLVTTNIVGDEAVLLRRLPSRSALFSPGSSDTNLAKLETDEDDEQFELAFMSAQFETIRQILLGEKCFGEAPIHTAVIGTGLGLLGYGCITGIYRALGWGHGSTSPVTSQLVDFCYRPLPPLC